MILTVKVSPGFIFQRRNRKSIILIHHAKHAGSIYSFQNHKEMYTYTTVSLWFITLLLMFKCNKWLFSFHQYGTLYGPIFLYFN